MKTYREQYNDLHFSPEEKSSPSAPRRGTAWTP